MSASSGPDEAARMKVREYLVTAGTLGATSGQTLMVVLLPVILADYAPSAVWIGAVVAGEGLFALILPYATGILSDLLPGRLVRRWGRRGFFLRIATPIMVLSLALTPWLSGFWPLAAAALTFFLAFNAYQTPLWALMIETVPEERRARVQGARGLVHTAGLLFGLVGGALLFAIWRPLPFLVAAALVPAGTAATLIAVSRGHRQDRAPDGGAAHHGALRRLGAVVRRPDTRWFLLGNVMWTGAIDGLRPYIFIFAVTVLGLTVAETAVVLLPVLAGVGVGALLAGQLGDLYGRFAVLAVGTAILGLGLGAGATVHHLPTGVAMVLLPLIGAGAATTLALPYPLFSSLLGERAVGEYTGLFILSSGVARLVPPILIGAAIDWGTWIFPAQDGYPAMWLVAGALALGGCVAVLRAAAANRAMPDVAARD